MLACGLAAGGLSAALLIPDGSGTTGTNIIVAGHLQVEINHGQGSDLSLDGLVPGDSKVAYQLVTGDMSGFDAADLDITLAAAADTEFTQNLSLTVAVSAPFAESSPSDPAACSASTAFGADLLSAPAVSGLTTESTVAAGQLTQTARAVCVRFTVGLDKHADNPVQDKSSLLNLTYSLTQTPVVTP